MKERIQDLAILGGTPAMEEPCHVGRPNIGERDALMERINDILDSRWLSNNGRYVQELESRICDMTGAKHCIAMTNGSVALEIAIRALGLSGEVIVPSYTFIATAHSLQWQEITPVFADIKSSTHTLDPAKVVSMITPRTTGIIGVHTWGRPCAIEELEDVARKHDLKLMFDAAHAFGCSYNGQKIGNFGECEIYSFHATKFINSFEGGAIVTNNDELASKIRLMKNFGFAGYDNVIYVGTNGKMSEVSAAMGITSIESMDDFIATNYANYQAYQQGLSDIPGVSLIRYDESNDCNFQYMVMEMDETLTGISRDQLIDVLHAENVIARRYFYPGCHRMEPYRSHQPHAHMMLPVTEEVAAKVVVLPTGTAMNTEQIANICQIIRTTCTNGSELSKQIQA